MQSSGMLYPLIPASTERPLAVRQPALKPPGVWLASRIVTLMPAWSKAYAAPKPAHPPPTTMACFACVLEPVKFEHHARHMCMALHRSEEPFFHFQPQNSRWHTEVSAYLLGKQALVVCDAVTDTLAM